MSIHHKHIPRIYIKQLADVFNLNEFQSNHLVNVFRLKIDDRFVGFNQIDGEWECTLQSVNKKSTVAKRISLIRTFEPKSKLYIAFGIIKPDNVRLIIEKCTELGVTEFFPLITDYTQCRNINIDKLQMVAIQASEQSERLDIPVIHEPMLLKNFIGHLPEGVTWMTALERFDGTKSVCLNGDVGFIIGAEGGFSDHERALLTVKTIPISLGTNILRAETACITCACLHQYCSS